MKVAIVGAGKLGLALAEALVDTDNAVTLIDKNPDILQHAEENMDIMTVTCNAKNPDALKEMNIASFDVTICVADEDEKNMVIGQFAKALGSSKSIVRVRDPEYVHQHGFLLRTLGVDYIVNPDRAVASEIARYLTQFDDSERVVFHRDGIAIVQVPASSLPGICGKRLADIGKFFKSSLVTAISRDGKIIIPNGSTAIEASDSLFILGNDETLQFFDNANAAEDSRIHSVMLIGGGKASLYLAEKIISTGMLVKIIEQSRARCEYLARRLPDARILCGDGTDISFLEDEGLANTDAFAALTGFDEDNMMLALLAKEHGVENVIAKVSRRNYGELAAKIGISMVLNPTDITVAQVLRYLQGKNRIVFSQVIQGQAEFLEILAGAKMPILHKPLAKLTFPENVLIAGIRRGSDMIIPKGTTTIEEGDRVFVFGLLPQLPAIEEMFREK